MRGSSHPVTWPPSTSCEQAPLAHHRVVQVEARELVLVRHRRRPAVLDEPVVQRPVILELERADRVRDALDGVGERMREVVHRIDAPRVAGPVMRWRAGCGRGRDRACSGSATPCRSARAARAPRRGTRRRACGGTDRGSRRPAARGTGSAGPAPCSVPRYARISSRRQAVDVRLAVADQHARRTRRAARSSPTRRRGCRPSRSRASGCPPGWSRRTRRPPSSGLVSSNRRLQTPPNSCAMPKFRQMLFAWPMCR